MEDGYHEIKLPGGGHYQGEFKDSKFHGQGVLIESDGARYEGEFKDGLIYQGALIETNVGRYEGEFRNGLCDGQGVYVWHNGIQFEGEFKDDLPFRGVTTFANGCQFEGESKYMKYVKGKLTYPDGNQFEGEFKDDLPLLGKFTFLSGLIFEGEFRNGFFHGQGILKNPDGNQFEGEFKDHLPLLGKFTFLSGLIFEGEFRNFEGEFIDGFFHGQGIFKHPDGFEYEGEFINGELQTKGTYKDAGGFEYEGEFKNNFFHGEGVSLEADGIQYEGRWKKGKRHGQGKLILEDGKIFEGKFKNGMAHGIGQLKSPEGEIINEGVWKKHIAPNMRGKRIGTTPEINDDEKIPIKQIFDTFTGESRSLPVMTLDMMDSMNFRSKKITLKNGEETVALVEPSYYRLPESYKQNKEWLGEVTFEKTMGSKAEKAKINFPDETYYRGGVEGITPDGFGSYHMMNDIIVSGNWEESFVTSASIYMDKYEFEGPINRGEPSIKGKLFHKGKLSQISGKQEMLDLIRDTMGTYPNGKEIYFNWQTNLSEYIQKLNSKYSEFGLKEDIDADESEILEFKSSIWAQYNNVSGELNDKQKIKMLELEDSVIKTIAAFLNTQGGTLIIGVQDKPARKVVGIEADFQYSGKSKDIESFQNTLSQIIKSSTNEDTLIGTYVNINTKNIDNKTICVVDVKQKGPKSWTYVDMKNWKGKGKKKDCFFVRSGPSSNLIDSRKSADEWKESRRALHEEEE